MTPHLPEKRNPFIGPASFARGQKYFGRDSEIEDLYHLLNSERIVMLYSPSGAGKTSLLNAGLLPRLAQSFDVWGVARVSVPPPDGSAGLNRYVRSVNLGFEADIPPKFRRAAEKIGAMDLNEYFAGRPCAPGASLNVVLIFDQFEELLTTDPLEPESKHDFFRQLGALLHNPHVWALFSLREDYLARFDPYADYIPNKLRVRYRIDLLTRSRAAEVMRLTAAEGIPKREFENGASSGSTADMLADDLATVQVQQPDGNFKPEKGSFVEPLFLQVVCQRLWETLEKTCPEKTLITDDLIAEHAKVDGSLAAYYDACVSKCAQERRDTERRIREWVDANLILPGFMRGQLLKQPGKTAGLSNELIARLSEGHQLVRAETRAGATWFELAHDRLVQPVMTSNREWLDKNLEEVEKRAKTWNRENRIRSLLFIDQKLRTARQWEAEQKSDSESVEFSFLRASEEEQKRVDRERALAAQIKRALVQSAIARAAAAVNVRMHRWREDEALAYLASALEIDPSSIIARCWVTNLLMYKQWLRPLQVTAGGPDHVGSDSPPRAMFFSEEDSGVALIQEENNRAGVIDLSTGESRAEFDLPDAVTDAWLTRAGTMVLRFRNGATEVWSFSGEPARLAPIEHDGRALPEIRYTLLSPSGKHIVVSSGELTLLLRVDGSASPSVTIRVLSTERAALSGAFDNSESTLATGWRDSKIRFFTVPGAEKSGEDIDTDDYWPRQLEYAADGSFLAAAFGRTLQMYDAKTHQKKETALRHRANVASFSLFDDRALTAYDDGTVQLWDLNGRRRITGMLIGQPVSDVRLVTSGSGADTWYVALVACTHFVSLWYLCTVQNDNPVFPPVPAAPVPHFDMVAWFGLAENNGLLTASGAGTNRGLAAVWFPADVYRGAKHVRHPVRLSPPEGFEPYWACFSDDGRLLIVAWCDESSTNFFTELLRLDTGEPLCPPSNKRIATAADNDLRLCLFLAGNVAEVLADGAPICEPIRLDGPIETGSVCKDGHLLALAVKKSINGVDSEDLILVKSADPASRQTLTSRSGESFQFVSLSLSGHRLMLATTKGTLEVWDLEKRQVILSNEHHREYEGAAFIDNAGDRIYARSGRRVWLFDLVKDNDTPDLLVFDVRDQVSTSNFSENHIVTVSDDKTTELWELKTGRSVTGPILFDRGTRLRRPVFSRDGLLMAIVSAGGDIEIWDTQTGTQIGVKIDYSKERIFAAGFSGDGKYLMTVSPAGEITSWPILIGGDDAGDVVRHFALVAGRTRVSPAGTLEVISAGEVRELRRGLAHDPAVRSDPQLRELYERVFATSDHVT